MECTVTIDRELLEEARRALGTPDVQSTIEASLQEAIRTRPEPVDLPRAIRTPDELQQFLRGVRRPRTEAELARRQAAFEAAEKHRVAVGRDFNVVEALREIRERAAEALPAEMDDGE